MNWWPISLFFSTLSPLSADSQFQSRLTHALSLSGLQYSNLSYRQFLHQAEFDLVDDHRLTKVIISTQKNLYWQVSTLQQLRKTAKIKNKVITQVDLSLKHPYANLKNN